MDTLIRVKLIGVRKYPRTPIFLTSERRLQISKEHFMYSRDILNGSVPTQVAPVRRLLELSEYTQTYTLIGVSEQALEILSGKSRIWRPGQAVNELRNAGLYEVTINGLNISEDQIFDMIQKMIIGDNTYKSANELSEISINENTHRSYLRYIRYLSLSKIQQRSLEQLYGKKLRQIVDGDVDPLDSKIVNVTSQNLDEYSSSSGIIIPLSSENPMEYYLNALLGEPIDFSKTFEEMGVYFGYYPSWSFADEVAKVKTESDRRFFLLQKENLIAYGNYNSLQNKFTWSSLESAIREEKLPWNFKLDQEILRDLVFFLRHFPRNDFLNFTEKMLKEKIFISQKEIQLQKQLEKLNKEKIREVLESFFEIGMYASGWDGPEEDYPDSMTSFEDTDGAEHGVQLFQDKFYQLNSEEKECFRTLDRYDFDTECRYLYVGFLQEILENLDPDVIIEEYLKSIFGSSSRALEVFFSIREKLDSTMYILNED